MLWCISCQLIKLVNEAKKVQEEDRSRETGLATGYIQVLRDRCLGAHRDCLPRGHIFGYGEGLEAVHSLSVKYRGYMG